MLKTYKNYYLLGVYMEDSTDKNTTDIINTTNTANKAVESPSLWATAKSYLPVLTPNVGIIVATATAITSVAGYVLWRRRQIRR